MKILVGKKNKVEIEIDDEDLHFINDYKYNILKSDDRLYVWRHAVVNGKQTTTYLHRDIMSCKKGFEIDHINHNTLDNRRSNLRICKRIENSRNRRKQKNNRSGFTGVSFNKEKNKWQVFLGVNYKKIFLGYFQSITDANNCYKKNAKKVFGDFFITADT